MSRAIRLAWRAGSTLTRIVATILSTSLILAGADTVVLRSAELSAVSWVALAEKERAHTLVRSRAPYWEANSRTCSLTCTDCCPRRAISAVTRVVTTAIWVPKITRGRGASPSRKRREGQSSRPTLCPRPTRLRAPLYLTVGSLDREQTVGLCGSHLEKTAAVRQSGLCRPHPAIQMDIGSRQTNTGNQLIPRLVEPELLPKPMFHFLLGLEATDVRAKRIARSEFSHQFRDYAGRLRKARCANCVRRKHKNMCAV